MTIYEVADDEEPPLSQVASDWFGEEVVPPVFFSFAIDGRELVFRAAREATACCHPDSRPGLFQPGLWQYDVAEFFLTDPASGNYLECNLSPNGAHWACLFDSPRHVLSELRDVGLRSEGSCGPDGWRACLALPLGWLKERLHFGSATRMNAAFILDSPKQRFLTCVPLGGGDPGFHRPAYYAAHSVMEIA